MRQNVGMNILVRCWNVLVGMYIIKRVCDTYGYCVVGENKNDGVVFRIYCNNTKAKGKKKV